MSSYMVTSSELNSIASAIRTKSGTSESLEYPNGFITAIENIPTGSSVRKNDVTFYDYDGTVVAGYSASEFAQLTAMPNNPSHEGLVSQGWNWSLSDAKTHVAKYGSLNIGQMYITESGATEIDVVMHEGRLDPILTICVNGTITVDWGDNTTPDTVTGSDINARQAVPHTYAQAGTYTISISATGNNKYKFISSGQYGLLRKNTTDNENRVYTNTIQHVRIGSNADVGSSAFYNCYSLESITIPDGVTSIESSAFYYCHSLVSVTIPDGITSIGNGAFSACCSLESITIPDGIISIGNSVFYQCNSLASITIPDSVMSIGGTAFYYCSFLVSIRIPDSVTSIGQQVFWGCHSLVSVTIPDGITSIGTSAFSSCSSLASITIPDSVTSIGSNAFSGCSSLASITIPDGVTSIGSQAFYYCSSLSSITIPSGVTSMDNNAFQNCYGVKEYHILPTTPPTAGTTIFDNLPSDCVIYVPSASLEAYKTATGWSTYASYMQEEP